MTTAVAKAKETAVSADVMDDIFDMAGEGTSFDSSEMQIPFIRVLQALSPQLNKKKPEYIEGRGTGRPVQHRVRRALERRGGCHRDPLLPDHQVSGVRATGHGRRV
jgi:hypothetical protein